MLVKSSDVKFRENQPWRIPTVSYGWTGENRRTDLAKVTAAFGNLVNATENRNGLLLLLGYRTHSNWYAFIRGYAFGLVLAVCGSGHADICSVIYSEIVGFMCDCSRWLSRPRKYEKYQKAAGEKCVVGWWGTLSTAVQRVWYQIDVTVSDWESWQVSHHTIPVFSLSPGSS